MKRAFFYVPIALSLGIACAVRSNEDDAARSEAPVTITQNFVTHGPILGDPRADRVTVWARLAKGGTVRVKWRQGTGAFQSPVSSPTGSDGTAQVVLTGLTANTDYAYELSADGTTWSSEYRFRTAPNDTDKATFSFVVLSDFAPRRADALATALHGNPAFAVLMGDLDHSGPGDKPDPLAAMREMRQQLRVGTWVDGGTSFGGDFFGGSDDAGGFIANATRQIPLYYSWDDHDYCDNNADYGCDARPQAFQVLKEYFVPARNANFDKGTYQIIRWGSQAVIYLLDARSNRNFPDDAGKPDHSTMLGPDQMAWLKSSMLAAKQAGVAYHFLLSPVPFNTTTKRWDSWGLYPEEHDEILAYVDSIGIPHSHITVVSGDIHSGGALDDGTNAGLPELSVPQANMGDFVNTFLKNDASTAVWTHGKWDNGWPNDGLDAPGYVQVDVDAKAGTATLSVRDGKTGEPRSGTCGHPLTYTMHAKP